MSHRLIKRPDGLWAVWSTIVDDFVLDGVTLDDYVADARERAADDAEKEIRRVAAELEAGRRPYHQFTESYAEACETRDELLAAYDDEDDDECAQNRNRDGNETTKGERPRP